MLFLLTHTTYHYHNTDTTTVGMPGGTQKACLPACKEIDDDLIKPTRNKLPQPIEVKG
jgi:hypothetical protein